MDRATFDRNNEVRTDGQIHLGPVNIEGLDDDELAIACEHPALHEEVKLFARLTKVARAKRLAGLISTAVAYERRADFIYNTTMPKKVRW